MINLSKTIQVRVDDNLKKQSDELFNALGTSTNEAIKIFLTSSIQHGGIPFTVTLKQPNAETKQAMDSVEKGEYYGGFSSVSDVMDELNA